MWAPSHFTSYDSANITPSDIDEHPHFPFNIQDIPPDDLHQHLQYFDHDRD
jgi:hypothetical protein